MREIGRYLREYNNLEDGKKLKVRKAFMEYLRDSMKYGNNRDKLVSFTKAVVKTNGFSLDENEAIQSKFLLKVLWIILEDPLATCKSIAEKAGLEADKEKLIKINAQLKNIPFFGDLLTYNSRAPRAVSMFKEASRIEDVVNVIEGKKPHISRFEFWLGFGCQYICDHCFSTEVNKSGKRVIVPHPKPRPSARPITIEELNRVIDEGLNPEKGFCVPYFLFSGGKEPFAPGTVKKVTEAVKYIKERAGHYRIKPPKVAIYTNGIGINEKVAKVCVENVDNIRISLDGATTDTWQNVIHTISEKTKDKVNFENIVRNILELVEVRDKLKSPMRIRIANLLLKGNFKEWKKMVKLALLLGVDMLEFKRYIGWPEEIGDHEPDEKELIKVVEKIRELMETGNFYKALYKTVKGEILDDNIVKIITEIKDKSERQLLKENVRKLNIFIEDTFKIEISEDGAKHFMPFFHQSYDKDKDFENNVIHNISEKTKEKTWLKRFPGRCLATDLWWIVGPYGEVLVCTPMLHARIMRDLVLGENHPEYIKGIIGDYEEDPLTNIFNNSRESVKKIDTHVCFYRCDHNGINFNWIFKKILADMEWGINLDQQPFNPAKDLYLKLTNKAV